MGNSSSSPKSLLVNAAGAGDLQEVKRQLDAGADVDSCSDNYSALSKASDGGFVNIVRLLISRGANINLAPPEKGWTALYCASNLGALSVAELLLASGADPNVVAANGNTCLHIACSQDHLNVAELLIRKGADLTVKNKDGATALELCWDANKRVALATIAAESVVVETTSTN